MFLLYVKNQDLDVFYNISRIGKTVELCLKKSQEYTQAQRNDILFYVMYYSVAQIVNKTTMLPSDIKTFDFSVFTEEHILKAASFVFEKYTELGGDGKVAKSSELINVLMGSFTCGNQ